MLGLEGMASKRKRNWGQERVMQPTVNAVVPDPYSQIGESREVQAAVRDDPLRAMLARGQIDTAQFNAGRMWQRYREQSEVGGVKAIDTTKEPVDGGGSYPEPITDRQRRAVLELQSANKVLGEYGRLLVESVLWRRLSITQAAAERAYTTERGIKYLGRRFNECLEELARLWGLVGK